MKKSGGHLQVFAPLPLSQRLVRCTHVLSASIGLHWYHARQGDRIAPRLQLPTLLRESSPVMSRDDIPLLPKQSDAGLSLIFATLCIVDIFGVFPIIALPRAIVECGKAIEVSARTASATYYFVFIGCYLFFFFFQFNFYVLSLEECVTD